MMRNKKRIERLENEFANFEKSFIKLKNANRQLENTIEILEKNTKALFEEYVVGTNNLVCPVCGDKVHLVIDERYKHCKGVFGFPSIEDDGTFVYKIKCNNHCVCIRDESIFGAIEKFKSLKVGGEDEETGAAL